MKKRLSPRSKGKCCCSIWSGLHEQLLSCVHVFKRPYTAKYCPKYPEQKNRKYFFRGGKEEWFSEGTVALVYFARQRCKKYDNIRNCRSGRFDGCPYSCKYASSCPGCKNGKGISFSNRLRRLQTRLGCNLYSFDRPRCNATFRLAHTSEIVGDLASFATITPHGDKTGSIH